MINALVTFFCLLLVRLLHGFVIPVNKVHVVLRFLLVMVCEDSQAREKQKHDDQDNADANIEGGVVSLIILNVRSHQLKLPGPRRIIRRKKLALAQY